MFHDRPPQGGANAEVFDVGLGLLRRVLPLPHAQSRLRLHDRQRIALFARRFAPQSCLTLEHGAFAHYRQGRLLRQAQCFELGRSGVLTEPVPWMGHADA